MERAKSFLSMAAIWSAVMLAACGGGETPTRSVTVSHGGLSGQAGRVEYRVVDEDGAWTTLPAAPGIASDVVEVPETAKVLLVRVLGPDDEVLNEQAHLLTAGEQVSQPVRNDRWMTDDAGVQKSTLFGITLPGAHDAGMGKVDSCSFYANEATTRTQNTTVGRMLNDGIRYFDMRPMFVKPAFSSDPEMRLGHYSWVGTTVNLGIHKFTLRNEGCAGYTVRYALENVRDFMQGGDNRELVILKFSHFQNLRAHDTDHSHFDAVDFRALEEMIEQKLGPYLLRGNRNFRTTPIAELTADGPKVIVTFDASGYDGSTGIYPQSDLILYDEYSKTASVSDMRADQFSKMETHAPPLHGEQYWVNAFMCQQFVGPMSTDCYKRARAAWDKQTRVAPLFVLSWTLTQTKNQMIACSVAVTDELKWIAAQLGYECKTLPALGQAANKHIDDIVTEVSKQRRYPHVVYVDQSDKKATNAAILINQMH
ncbi:hypothetical protein [Simplicispira lacusdiani]|uniref:hypothetical protein n=1 Tax=Simplicispira lacusdiani TaxID=2213010 RepID=UPI00130080A4|nr:hypothetical protein [Simplicispira lacusdiani]